MSMGSRGQIKENAWETRRDGWGQPNADACQQLGAVLQPALWEQALTPPVLWQTRMPGLHHHRHLSSRYPNLTHHRFRPTTPACRQSLPVQHHRLEADVGGRGCGRHLQRRHLNVLQADRQASKAACANQLGEGPLEVSGLPPSLWQAPPSSRNNQTPYMLLAKHMHCAACSWCPAACAVLVIHPVAQRTCKAFRTAAGKESAPVSGSGSSDHPQAAVAGAASSESGRWAAKRVKGWLGRLSAAITQPAAPWQDRAGHI